MSFQFGSVILYGDPYFVGTNSSFTLAKTNDNQTFAPKSIFIPADVSLTVYDTINYTGQKQTYTSSVLDTTTSSIFTAGNTIQSYIVQYSKVPYYKSNVKPDPTQKVLFYDAPFFSNTGNIIYQQSVGTTTGLKLLGTLSIKIPEGMYVTITDDVLKDDKANTVPNTLTFYHDVQRLDLFYSTGTFAKITAVTVNIIDYPACVCAACQKCEKCKISNKFYDFIQSKTFLVIVGVCSVVLIIIFYFLYKTIVNNTLQGVAQTQAQAMKK